MPAQLVVFMCILYVHVKYDFCQREVNCMLKSSR